MTKAELSDKIYEKIGLSRKEALGIVEMLFESGGQQGQVLFLEFPST